MSEGVREDAVCVCVAHRARRGVGVAHRVRRLVPAVPAVPQVLVAVRVVRVVRAPPAAWSGDAGVRVPGVLVPVVDVAGRAPAPWCRLLPAAATAAAAPPATVPALRWRGAAHQLPRQPLDGLALTDGVGGRPARLARLHLDRRSGELLCGHSDAGELQLAQLERTQRGGGVSGGRF